MHDASTSRRLVIGALLVALLAIGVTGYWLWVLRDHRVQFTQRQVRLQTAALAEHASVVLNSVDASLRGTVRDVREAGGVPPDAQRGLRQRLSGHPFLKAISLVGADGRVLASSWSDPPPPVHLPSSADRHDGRLSVGTPSTNPFDGREAISLSRGVADGGDVAQVVATVDNAFVSDFFGRVAVADDARAALFTSQGVRLGGAESALAPLDAAGGHSENASASRSNGERASNPATAAALHALMTPDAAEHTQFVAAQMLDGLPIVAVTSRNRAEVFAPWGDYLASAIAALLLLLGVLAFIVHRLQREMHARREAQAALQRTQRLESIGRLAGGIAHDFNNILALVLGFGELLTRQLPREGAAAQHAGQIVRAGERGRRLVERILAFSSGTPRPASAVEVDAVVGEAADLLLASAPPGVTFERALDAQGAFVLGDANALFEAINNLVANALHALHASSTLPAPGGNIRIETRTLQVGTGRALSHGRLTAGDWVRISVTDDGIGMAHDQLERLFEPFFTTRQAEGGTGLGLATVHGTVKDAGGAIDVQSAPGRGALFALYLPRAQAHTAAASLKTAHRSSEETVAPDLAPRGHGQVVMVVDDEPALVSLTEELLAELGYEPAGFRDPQLALDVLRRSPQRFDALLTDQVMPGLAGTELARALHALRPEAPILLATGFSNPELAQRAREAGVSALLAKPLQRAELARQLAKAFAAR